MYLLTATGTNVPNGLELPTFFIAVNKLLLAGINKLLVINITMCYKH